MKYLSILTIAAILSACNGGSGAGSAAGGAGEAATTTVDGVTCDSSLDATGKRYIYVGLQDSIKVYSKTCSTYTLEQTINNPTGTSIASVRNMAFNGSSLLTNFTTTLGASGNSSRIYKYPVDGTTITNTPSSLAILASNGGIEFSTNNDMWAEFDSTDYMISRRIDNDTPSTTQFKADVAGDVTSMVASGSSTWFKKEDKIFHHYFLGNQYAVLQIEDADKSGMYSYQVDQEDYLILVQDNKIRRYNQNINLMGGDISQTAISTSGYADSFNSIKCEGNLCMSASSNGYVVAFELNTLVILDTISSCNDAKVTGLKNAVATVNCGTSVEQFRYTSSLSKVGTLDLGVTIYTSIVSHE